MLNFLYRRQRYSIEDISINGKRLHAIMADSFIKQMIGLMFRPNLKKDGCMLFVFNRKARHGIWMRNMRFPIDIMWLDADKKVIHSVESAPPGSARVYMPDKDSKYVLETNAGFIKRSRIKKGASLIRAL